MAIRSHPRAADTGLLLKCPPGDNQVPSMSEAGRQARRPVSSMSTGPACGAALDRAVGGERGVRGRARTAVMACSYCAAEMTAAAALCAAEAAAAATSSKLRCGASRRCRYAPSSSSSERTGGAEACRLTQMRIGAAPTASARGLGAAGPPPPAPGTCGSGALLRPGRSGGAAASCPERDAPGELGRLGCAKPPTPASPRPWHAWPVGDSSPWCGTRSALMAARLGR